MQLTSILAAVAATANLAASAPAAQEESPSPIRTVGRSFVEASGCPVGTSASPSSSAVPSTSASAKFSTSASAVFSTSPSTALSSSPYATPSATTSLSSLVPSAPKTNLTRGPDHPIWASECIYQCAPKTCQFTVRMRNGPECGGSLEKRLKKECNKGIERFHCDWRWHEVHFWAPRYSKRPKITGLDGKLHKEPIHQCVGNVAGEIWSEVHGCHG